MGWQDTIQDAPVSAPPSSAPSWQDTIADAPQPKSYADNVRDVQSEAGAGFRGAVSNFNRAMGQEPDDGFDREPVTMDDAGTYYNKAGQPIPSEAPFVKTLADIPANAVRGAVLSPVEGALRTAGLPNNISQDVANLGALGFGARGAISDLRSGITDLTQPAADSFARSRAANKAAAALEYDPDATHAAISDSYGAAKKKVAPYYNLMNEIGSGETADASGLKPQLQSMITDIENSPFHEAMSEVPYLKQQLAKISDNATMPLNDMVRLKQSLNSNFNPKRFSGAADTPYSAVGNTVDNALDEASQRIPEFGQAKQLADKNWLNTVKSPFEDNSVLQRFWQPEDYFAKKSVDNGMLEELPDATKERAATMADEISNPVELNAVRRVLPGDLADGLSGAVTDNITNGTNKSRLISFAKGIGFGATGRLPAAFNNFGAALRTYSPAERALLDAADEPAPSLSTKYDKPFRDLNASVQQMKDSAGEMQPMQYGPTTPGQEFDAQMARQYADPNANVKALPAPPTYVDSSGNAGVPVKPSYTLPRTGVVAETGKMGSGSPAPIVSAPDVPKLTPRQQRAADAGKAMSSVTNGQAGRTLQNLASGKPPSAPPMGLQDLAPPTLSDSLARESASQGNAEYQQMLQHGYTPQQLKAMGYKRGGRVISDLQKQAGNYKKEKVNFQGLPVSIETPQGEERSGKDRDGKEWRVTMPVAYGYIRKTTAADGQHVDCFVGPAERSNRVYLIDQHHAETGGYDEAKAMLGFTNRADAMKAYCDSFSDNKGKRRIGGMTRISVREFKDWLKKGDTKSPYKSA